MDRFEAMSVLLSVVDAGSLSAASRRLRIPLTTVSRNVSELEARLKTRLLNRTSRRIELTEAGLAFVAACRRIVEEVGEAERAASGEYSAPTGELVISAPIVFGRLHVLPVVAEFLKAYPDISVRATFADRLVNLIDEHVDVALRIGELSDSSLLATRLGSIRRVTCASPTYLAERGTPATPADLAGHDCITFVGIASPTSWSFRSAGKEVSAKIHSRLLVNTAEAAIDAAAAGLGITRVLGYQIAAATRAGELALLLEAFEPEPAPLSLVYDGQGLIAKKVRAFIDFAVPRLKARVATSSP